MPAAKPKPGTLIVSSPRPVRQRSLVLPYTGSLEDTPAPVQRQKAPRKRKKDETA